MEQLGYEEGKDYVIHDGKVKPKGLERGMERKGPQESVLFTTAYLQAKQSHGDEQARRMAEGPGAEELIHARLQDFGTTRRPEFAEVERPTSWEKRAQRVMDKVKKMKKLACDSKNVHLAHQLSFDVMMEKVVELVRNDDVEGLERFVDEFAENNNTLLEEINDDPEVYQEMKVVLQEQKEDIYHKLESVREAMHSTQSDEELHREVEELLEHMNSFFDVISYWALVLRAAWLGTRFESVGLRASAGFQSGEFGGVHHRVIYVNSGRDKTHEPPEVSTVRGRSTQRIPFHPTAP